MEPVIKNADDKMQKAIEALKKKLSGIRTGRAHPSLVEDLQVEYYGSPCVLKSLAQIAIPEPRIIAIQPYDKNVLKDIEKAIQKSNLGVNPVSEGGKIRLSLPSLNEERRRELTKLIKTTAEESRVALRNIRRDIMEELKKKKTNKELSLDAEKIQEEELQKTLNKYIQQIDSVAAAKEKEILEV